MGAHEQFDDFAWFVGVFEGEGCIDIHRVRTRVQTHAYPNLRIRMTDEDVIRSVHRISARGCVTGPHRPPSHKDNWKAYWVWRARGHDALQLLHRMLPHLHGRRREKALEVLAMCDVAPEQERLEIAA